MPKVLFDAPQDIIKIIRSSSKSQSDPWMEIVKQCKPPGMIEHQYCTPVEQAIERYISEIGEEDKRSIWLDTETGQMNWQDAENIHIGSIEMELREELFQEIMDLAFYAASHQNIPHKTWKASMKKERNKMIAIKVLNGATLSSIGKEYGIVPERVRQIVFRVCLRAVYKRGLRDKLPEKWFYLRNARQYKDLLINAIEDYWG